MTRICSLIVNPTSGGYSGEKLRQVAAALEAGGLAPEILQTKNAGEVGEFAGRICRERDEPFIVACGGDGTVNGVINGLEPGKATLAVLPLGTANVLARELGIGTPGDAVKRIVRGETRPLTVGILEKGDMRRRFLLMAGIGFDGRVVQGVRESEKRILGKGAYLLAAARHLLDWDREPLTVTCCGRELRCHTAVVCNAARYGGGFLLAPGADLFAPHLQVVCMTADTRSAYLRLAVAVISGKVADNRDVVSFPAVEILVSGNKAVQVDGDFYCHSPVRITAHGGFARLIA